MCMKVHISIRSLGLGLALKFLKYFYGRKCLTFFLATLGTFLVKLEENLTIFV